MATAITLPATENNVQQDKINSKTNNYQSP